MISDRELQFIVELTNKLNRILEIETKLSTSFHLQTDRKTKCMNQELEQSLQFFVNYKQKNWPEWLVMAEFTVNNKIYSATKVSLSMVTYNKELRMEANIRKKEKVEKTMEFAERIKKIRSNAEKGSEINEVANKQEKKESESIEER